MPSTRVVLGILALALTVRVATVLLLHGLWGPEALLIEDSGKYRIAAAAGLRHADVMPAYLAFLRVFETAFGPGVLWPVLGQAMVDALTCVAIAGMAGSLAPRLAARYPNIVRATRPG